MIGIRENASCQEMRAEREEAKVVTGAGLRGGPRQRYRTYIVCV